jgi:hypothetical protein
MRVLCTALLSASVLAFPALGIAATGAVAHPGRVTHHSATVKHPSKLHKSTRTTSRREAPSGMPSERATEIQTALIKQGYLSGAPTGSWDAASIAAMQRLQSDNGWQSKITPDARALIKLGLGPQPVTASATAPHATLAQP